MQLGLVALAMVFLGSMGHSDALKLSKTRRQRRVSTEGPPSCPKGCDRCSEYNGCIKCRPKLFIFLERNDIRQIGVCLASCPMGYFGMRNPEGNNRCTLGGVMSAALQASAPPMSPWSVLVSVLKSVN
ncbi:R-spondin-1 isoform X2 [Pseudoliparis swirei]|uniref:R-spondin-1 isoform X2 n=1 Tax=Pseudoliparis swirei TaxID=2059687 RepID=UPI0024BECDE0|nr:R-spondin-1 isoform X2 [Pseudoliparis swirei]